MGKTHNAGMNMLFNPYVGIKEQDENRVMAKEKYGFIPKSVWTLTKDRKLVSYIGDTFGGGSYSKGVSKKKGQKDLSLLNPNVIYNILKFYTEIGDVVVAPYSSRGVVGFVANLMQRHSFNTEIVPTYLTDMKTRAQSVLKSNKNGCALEFYLDDARVMKTIPSDFADLTYFNPPYWNVEKYESVDGQMSDCGTYEEFLEFYFAAIQSKFRVTKPGGWCIANLNDFRRPGVFVDFHTDTIMLMKKAGFIIHDVIINEIFSRSITSIGTTEMKGYKTMAKCHEYILVFKKPFVDGSVWRNWHEYRSEQRTKRDHIKSILAHHKKIGFVPRDGYSWDKIK